MKKFLRQKAVCVLLMASAPAFAAQYDQRLANLSTRAQVGTGSNVMITGFVVQEGAPKKVLIRAVGARLATAPFNITGALADPLLQLYNADGVLVLSNDNWSSTDLTTMNSVGAFALTSGSRDAALVATLSPGAYTAQVSGVGNTSGVAILEVYDVTGSARLMNLSTRALVGSGTTTFFSGLSVAAGGGARRVLVRAAGPALGALGVGGALADPAIAILDTAGRQIANGANDNWESGGAAALTPAQIRQPGLQQLIDDMVDTMVDYEGVGLAAPQVYQSVRLIVLGYPDADPDNPDDIPLTLCINPEWESLSEEKELGYEGCLSIPDLRGLVPRSKAVAVRALDRRGKPFTLKAEGFLARILQHEIDHLDGVLMLDRMEPADRKAALKLLREQALAGTTVAPRHAL